MSNHTILIKWKWIILAIGILVILFFLFRSCDDPEYEGKIEGLDKEILDLKNKNTKLQGEAVKYIEDAEANQKVVEALKVEVAESKAKIKELEKEEVEIERIVMELPPSRLVEDLQKVLKCEEILLNEDGILFSVECARQGLLKLEKFSLVEEKYNEAIFALSKSEEALHFSERRSWNLYGALWKLGDQIINLKSMGKKKDLKFTLSEKQNKKSWWNGLKVGLVIGGGITITFVVIIPAIKKIFF